MEIEAALSAADVPNPTRPTNEPTRPSVNTSHEESVPTDFRLLIGGRLVEGAGTLDVINPRPAGS